MKKNVIIISAVIFIAIAVRFILGQYGHIMQGIMMKKGATPSVTVTEIQ